MIKLNLKYFPEEEIKEYYLVQVVAHLLVVRTKMAVFWNKKINKLKDIMSKQDENTIAIFGRINEKSTFYNRLRMNIDESLNDAKKNYARYYFLILRYGSKKEHPIVKMLKYTKLLRIAEEEYKRLTKDWSGVDRAIYGSIIRRVR